MKKLFFGLAIIVAGLFLNSCSSEVKNNYSGTEMYLNEPRETLYEKNESWEMVSDSANVVTVIKGDNLWDLAQHCGGDPYAWEEIYFMNQPALTGRLEYKDLGDGLGLRPWVWIYPGEELKVPAYFSCSRLRYVEYVEQFEYYRPTNLPVKLIEHFPSIDAQKILLLDEAPTKVAPPITSPVYESGDSSDWGILEWLLEFVKALFLIVIIIFLLWLIWNGFKELMRSLNGSSTGFISNRNTGAQDHTESRTAEDASANIAALTAHLKQLQTTGGTSNFTIGNVNANFTVPPQEESLDLIVIIENNITFTETPGEEKKEEKK